MTTSDRKNALNKELLFLYFVLVAWLLSIIVIGQKMRYCSIHEDISKDTIEL